MRFLSTTSLCVSIIISASALSTPAIADVKVGAEDGANCFPFGCSDAPGIDSYEIYNASSFSGVTSFNTISFIPFENNPVRILSGNYAISFGTTLAALKTNPAGMLSNVSPFYDGLLVHNKPSIAGNTYTYDPSDGNLVLHIVISGQARYPNGHDNTYFYADYTGNEVSRSYTQSNGFKETGIAGLVTIFSNGSSMNVPTPEPETWVLMVVGFAFAGLAMRQRRNSIAIAA